MLRTLLLKSTMVIFFVFQLHSQTAKQQKEAFTQVHRVVRKKLNFGLRVCRIFSCVILLVGAPLIFFEFHKKNKFEAQKNNCCFSSSILFFEAPYSF